ncbi:MAG: tRNA (N6-threonylcarbamoyladenosine(37)-N6)-methyltransferase TrmO [Clostridiales bacterium]|nr:tRNA (N6-threonylcarbamoyladenosine(37)-N6)-methyltransferase TrmO [Clostridiales bacterium]
MPETCEMKIIARIQSDFGSKFGVPRQSGLVNSLTARVVFEPEYRCPEALRGLDGYSHLWLIWQFSECVREKWSPTVRPPRLGGNTRMGVFATRSPFRPNAIGLSSVILEKMETDPVLGPVLLVRGADLMDGTPILDIKPYLPYTDSHPEAMGGFALGPREPGLAVEIPSELMSRVPREKRQALTDVLTQDPRPGYQREDGRMYGVSFAGLNVRFSVKDGVLTVAEIG